MEQERQRFSDKARLSAARAAFKKIRTDKELFAAAGIGPGDAYTALWSFLIEARNYWMGSKEQERRDYWQRQYVDVLGKLLPYERPRLQVVKVKTDESSVREPEEMARALAKALTPEELELLDKVALKLVSAPATIEGTATIPEPPKTRERPKRGRPPKR